RRACAPGGNRGTPEAPQTAGLDRPTRSWVAYRPRCANLLSESQPMHAAIQTVVEPSKAGVVPKRRTGPKRQVEEPNRSESGRDAGWRVVKGRWRRRSRLDRDASREWDPASPQRDR